MSGGIFHDEFKEEQNHKIHAFTYANNAARVAATGYDICVGGPTKAFDAEDVGKTAKQENNTGSDGIVTFWILTEHTAPAWKELTNTGLLTTDVKVKVSAADTTEGYLDSELTASVGTNPTNALEKSITSPGADEKLDIKFDESKVDHDALTNFVAAEHVDWSQSGAGTIHSTNYKDKFPWEALVDSSGGGDYTTIKAALDAGKKTLFIKNGTYVETGDLTISSGGVLFGESPGKVIITFNNSAYSVKIDGSGGVKESAGTVSITNGSTTVTGVGTIFTNLAPNDYILIGCGIHKIGSITNNTSLELADAYQGATQSGASFKGQTMAVGCEISNLVVTGSTVEGLYARAAYHFIFKDSLITSNGTISTTGNIHMIDCAESFLIAVSSENSKYHGALIEDCSVVHTTASIYKNNGHTGLRILNSSDIIIDGCNLSSNDLDGSSVEGTSDRVHINDTILCENNNKGVDCFSTSKRSIIDGCTVVSNGADGVDIDGTENIVSSSLIDNNGGNGIMGGDFGLISTNQITNNSGWGINNSNDEENTVVGNRILNNGSGGILQGMNHSTISSNTLNINSGPGIEITGNENTATGNTIRGSTIGIYMNGADLCTVTGNTIDNSSSEGINISSTAHHNTITGNAINGNSLDGIKCAGDDNVITSNRCYGNTQSGIEIIAGAVDTIVTSNNLKNNTGTNYVDGGTTTTSANNKT